MKIWKVYVITEFISDENSPVVKKPELCHKYFLSATSAMANYLMCKSLAENAEKWDQDEVESITTGIRCMSIIEYFKERKESERQ